jgi:hypothetical protein
MLFVVLTDQKIMRTICVALILTLFTSCLNDATEIGSDFFNDGALDLAMIDSSTVRLSTVQFESLSTNNKSRVLLGSHVDDRLGRISASTFFQPGLASVVSFKGKKYEYSHATLVFYPDEYSYYDTTQTLKVSAYRVTEAIELDENGALYNIDTFGIEAHPLGSISILARPHRTDSLEIPLEQSFGQELFDKAMASHDDLESNAQFIKYIKGFAVIPDTTVSGPIVGFSATPELRLYYTDKSVLPATLTYVSFKANSGYAFTSFTSDRQETQLANLSDSQKRLDARLTDGESYVQGGCGLALRIDLPYLRTLNQNENFYVTSAILEFYPVRNSYDAPTLITDALTGYEVNSRNSVYSENTYTAVLARDSDLERNTHYQLDVTAFVKTQMALEVFNENALLFLPYGNDYSVSAERIYFSQHNSEYNTRLKIYYATINQ